MINRYDQELKRIPQTIEWAINLSIDKLARHIDESLEVPLFSIGSGGSYSAANLAALLHQRSGNVANAYTPLNFTNTLNIIPNAGILLLSATGKNPDISSALKLAIEYNPKLINIICLKKNSPLGKLATNYSNVNLFEFDLPGGKDGFLATNSLIALSIFLIRSYSIEYDSTIENLINDKDEKFTTPNYSQIINKDTLFFLYGGRGLPAAQDAESKFSEAALANIQMVDYRNFAHGRHNWIAKRNSSTGIVALITPSEKEIARNTLKFLPEETSVVELETEYEGPIGCIDLLLQIFKLVNYFGESKKIDPARPNIPAFGRRLYHLQYKFKNLPKKNTQEELSIWRKSHLLNRDHFDDTLYKLWENAYRKYKKSLRDTEFGGLVLDFDGTLCDDRNRFGNLSQNIVQELSRLLNDGIILGIATGRGKSVREALQSCLPQKYWDKIIVGYYNGSDVALLSNNKHPVITGVLSKDLEEISIQFSTNQILGYLARIECRPHQIIIQAQNREYKNSVHSIVFDMLARKGNDKLQAVESSHSIDIVPFDVSKSKVIDVCIDILLSRNVTSRILCIGDQGEWPGNDYELLSHPFSLSVNTVSPDPNSCWNFSPLGYSGEKATLYYLKNIVTKNDKLKVKI